MKFNWGSLRLGYTSSIHNRFNERLMSLTNAAIYQLPFDRFAVIRPLFANTGYEEPFLDSVFQGIMPGQLFTDDPRRPTAALMCRTYDYFVAGDAASPLRQFIHDAPSEAGVFHDFYGYVPLTEAWRDALVEDHGFTIIPRLNFIYPSTTPPMIDSSLLPAHGRLVPIDGVLAERADRELDETIGLFWSGYPNFVIYGFGMALMIGDEIVSVAFTCSVSRTMSNIGIATAHSHRRRGYAGLVARAYFAESLRRGLMPTWDCDEWNTGSVMTARHLKLTPRTPFTELGIGPYPRQKMTMTTGLWDSAAGEDGVVVWRPV